MEPWKSILLIIPAGLLLGTLGGHAARPVPLTKDERPWPTSVQERVGPGEPWRQIYDAGPEDLSPGRYSYRPAFDYDVFVWPDQRRDYSASILPEDYYRASPETRYVPGEPERPLTRSVEAELAAEQTGTALADTIEATDADQATLSRNGEVIALPPVPPRLEVADASAAVPTPEELE